MKDHAMTTTPEPQPTYSWPPQPAPAPKRPRRTMWLVLAAIAALLLLGAGIGIGIGAAGNTASPAATPQSELVAPVEDEPGLTPTTEPAVASGPALTAADMTLSLKTTQKQCFGSAGCNLTVEVRADRHDGVPAPDPDATWVVTYQVTGDESGPIVGSFEITGGTYEINEESLSTKSSKTKVSVKVVSVEKVGV